jgi:DHA2 family lincomycin resistance protein-like MFS transporter
LQERNSEKIDRHVIAAIVATGLLSFSGVIVETAMNICFPTLMREFNVGTGTVQWMTSIYLLILAIIVPTSAILKSNFKTKHLFVAANLFFIAGILIDGFAPAFSWLIIGRAIQGIGTGIALPLMFNIIMEQVPTAKVGMMMGFGNLITGVAPAIGPTFGGLIIASIGWRWIFYILVPFLLLSLVLGCWGIKQASALVPQRFDVLSFILIACLFTGLVFGFSNLSTQPFMSLAVAGAIVIGLIALLALIWRSLAIDQPILQMRLFANRRFSGHVLMLFLTQLCSLGFAFLLPNYVQLVNGNSALLAGLLVMPAGIAGALMSPVGGRLLDQKGARLPILVGEAIMLIVIAIFAVISPQMSNWMLMLVYIFYMLGMGMSMGCVMTSALQLVGRDGQTQGNAILNTVQQFAGSIGTSLVAMIVAQSQGKGGALKVTTAIGTQHAFFLLVCLAVLLLTTAFLSVPKEERN